MFLEIFHKIHKENTCVTVSFSNFIKKRDFGTGFPVNFAKFLRTPFSHNRTPLSYLAVLATAASFYWSFSNLPFTSLQLAIGTLYSVNLFYNVTNFCDSCSYLPSLLFLLLKTEFVSGFAFVLCSPFLLTERC